MWRLLRLLEILYESFLQNLLHSY